jgi:cruciform cutting endonuclease 1
MPAGPGSLGGLPLRQLHRLAVLVGAPCSGTKPVLIREIQKAIHDVPGKTTTSPPRNPLQIVSIDMGVRNLAYCHLSTSFAAPEAKDRAIRVSTWTRLSVEENHLSDTAEIQNRDDQTLRADAKKANGMRESYDPAVYARRAHSFVKQIIQSHQPTHVLIERQRFRSGGQAAVQEWTIRVGVFEAMLYSVFRTFMDELHYRCHVIPISPTQVNSFWLGSDPADVSKGVRHKAPAKEAKKQKIALVEKVLRDTNTGGFEVSLLEPAKGTASQFMSRSAKQRSSAGSRAPKLDDLSDSLLQGLAWIQWQKNRHQLETMGLEAFMMARNPS